MGKHEVPDKLYKLTGDDVASVGKGLYVVNTGLWRYQRPVTDPDLCKRCSACYMYCPVGCKLELNTHYDTNLDWCKGCGICAEVCPANAITMYEEVGEE
ncbi:4Fe-4S binding protein [Brevibacillus sp. H7]|uniref:4Fe-4S binding protein n=1 Tax=Brevibacillus sp. H7 TaxID=3349138 RepID=UPI003813C902